MVLGFRRRSTSKREDHTVTVRTSPSLPELKSQGIPWPENLVDVDTIRQSTLPERSHQGAVKSSLSVGDHAPIPFHKPFRGFPGQSNGTPGSVQKEGASISSLYMTSPPPPSAFDSWRSPGHAPRRTRVSVRKPRLPPTFNLMVVGGQGTGKTSLLRLLLETADISPTATIDQRAAVDRFLNVKLKSTQNIQTACVEICESRFDRVLFSVIDTPGLDFREGRELKLDRQVTGIVKYVDALFADTLNEESKVVRQSKGDHHIHLCIYMVDPSSIIPVSARRAQSSLPTKTRSETTITYRAQDLSITTEDIEPDDDGAEDDRPTLSPADLRVIRRLSARVNVLPVIARADSLTDEKLAEVKKALRRGLHEAGLDFGVFGPSGDPDDNSSFVHQTNGHANGNGLVPTTNGNGQLSENADGKEDEGEENNAGRQARPIIKLRSMSTGSARVKRSRSRSRYETSEDGDDREPLTPDLTDKESVANVRFSAHVVAKTDLVSLLPFALISPESGHRHLRNVSSDAERDSQLVSPSEDGHAMSVTDSLTSPIAPSTYSSVSARSMPYLQGPPEDLKGVFVRKFRWGTVDVLNPDHCDFAALRTAVLSTHMKVLKIHTREVLYEKYRTDKLLARRATHNISETETKRLLEDLGL
ncbi:septin family protein [Neolentinus lepideus HHB14362 ss-1]|uniref:Septin family protein n=1 Tax=Neolentinus lepideus HHB14362 ss-1 TaxID=1314782 RepID=A0A165R870_9AGAM|nr:septin family protein [Neolentinus lepideus HHB14362 ss-1]